MATRKARAATAAAVVARPAYEDFVPAMELVTEENGDSVRLHLPGFKKEELRALLGPGGKLLKIIGEQLIENNKRRRFQKEVIVSRNTDTTKITAKFEGDILYVKQPKLITPVDKNKDQNLPPMAKSSEPQKPAIVDDLMKRTTQDYVSSLPDASAKPDGVDDLTKQTTRDNISNKPQEKVEEKNARTGDQEKKSSLLDASAKPTIVDELTKQTMRNNVAGKPQEKVEGKSAKTSDQEEKSSLPDASAKPAVVDDLRKQTTHDHVPYKPQFKVKEKSARTSDQEEKSSLLDAPADKDKKVADKSKPEIVDDPTKWIVPNDIPDETQEKVEEESMETSDQEENSNLSDTCANNEKDEESSETSDEEKNSECEETSDEEENSRLLDDWISAAVIEDQACPGNVDVTVLEICVSSSFRNDEN